MDIKELQERVIQFRDRIRLKEDAQLEASDAPKPLWRRIVGSKQ